MTRREPTLHLIERLEWNEQHYTNEECYTRWRDEKDGYKRARARFIFIALLTDPNRKPEQAVKRTTTESADTSLYQSFFTIPYSFDELCELHYDMEHDGDQDALYDQAYHWVVEQLEAAARARKTTLDQLLKLCVSTAASSTISGIARKQFFLRLEKTKSFAAWHAWWKKAITPVEHQSRFNRTLPRHPPHCFSQVLLERLKSTARMGADFVTLYELFDESPCKHDSSTSLKLFGCDQEQLRSFAWAGIRKILLHEKKGVEDA